MPVYFGTTYVQFPTYTGFTDARGMYPIILDVNGDGKLDILQAYYWQTDAPVPWHVFLGNGNGGFTDGTAATFAGSIPGSTWPLSQLIADFNGDGRLDIFLSDWGKDSAPFPGARNTLVLSSGAAGMVNRSSTLPDLKDNSYSSSVGDINGDGARDIYVGNTGVIAPYFLINDGTGRFTKMSTGLPADLLAGSIGYTVSQLFDADGDGDADLLLGTRYNTSTGRGDARLLLNNGAGSFSDAPLALAAPVPQGTPYSAESFTPFDFNGDGRLDLVATYQVNNYASGKIQVLINDGGGAFRDATTDYIRALPGSPITYDYLAFVDMNGDGFLDMVARHGVNQPIFLNDGQNRFVQLPIVIEQFLGFITTADINGDGRLDIVESTFPTPEGENLRYHLAQDAGLTQTGDAAANGLMGDADNEVFLGLGGDDVIFGAQGNDTITGGAGADYQNGGAGNDVFIIASGDFAAGEAVSGGAGSDTLRLIGASDLRGGTLNGIERIEFQRAGAEATINILLYASQLAAIGAAVQLAGSAAQDSIQVFATSGASVSTAGWTFEFPAWGFDDYIVYVGDAGARASSASQGWTSSSVLRATMCSMAGAPWISPPISSRRTR